MATSNCHPVKKTFSRHQWRELDQLSHPCLSSVPAPRCVSSPQVQNWNKVSWLAKLEKLTWEIKALEQLWGGLLSSLFGVDHLVNLICCPWVHTLFPFGRVLSYFTINKSWRLKTRWNDVFKMDVFCCAAPRTAAAPTWAQLAPEHRPDKVTSFPSFFYFAFLFGVLLSITTQTAFCKYNFK